MKYIWSIFFLLLTIFKSYSAELWVGVSAQCNQPNHYDNLHLAILAGILNGSENDIINITETVSYTGETNGDYILTNWNSGGNGTLTLIGGFADCDGTLSGNRTQIGDNSKDIFDISDNSVVTLKKLEITQSDLRGMDIYGNSTVILEDVDVWFNQAGVSVSGGSYFEANVFSTIQGNQDFAGNPKGGGIHCFGNNTEVNFAGLLQDNRAQSGGNMYIEDGCFVELVGGAIIKGGVSQSAVSGGGILVHDGGELLANGGASRVQIREHLADFGAGLYVWGTGRATLLNTFFYRNTALDKGSGLYAINGGNTQTQVIMDRVSSCPFIISCSEFEDNGFLHSVVYVDNSIIKISRTLFDQNDYLVVDNVMKGIVHTTLTGEARLSHVNMINNDAFYLLVNFGVTEVAHLTAVGNSYDDPQIGTGDSWAWGTLGTLRIENSIWQDTQGGDDRTVSNTIFGKCNLIDVIGEWPAGTYVVGSADFINSAGGDSRQIASSDGVDMCLADSFAWNTDLDIETQASPVNENTNPQGSPGETGGLYDAGFDEVYDNIGEDEFLLSVQRTGAGSGSVVSTPVGIACGVDCSEVYFNGTLVTLFANGLTGSDFLSWSNCPLPNGNQCLISVTSSTTVFAEFEVDDLIFRDGFD